MAARPTSVQPQSVCNFAAKIRLLGMFCQELRRPHVDYLRDGIYELRAKERTVQYRILFFYHGRNAVILAHALTKEKTVPDRDIERAKERKRRYEQKPTQRRASEKVPQSPADL
ncbi:MAG TPA: type II toxin-antitoxin system RelE/ParE family toxin [Tepidisphaeraceae bacterium]